MNRAAEIEIILNFLKEEVSLVAENDGDELLDVIVKNGALIEKYQKELIEL